MKYYEMRDEVGGIAEIDSPVFDKENGIVTWKIINWEDVHFEYTAPYKLFTRDEAIDLLKTTPFYLKSEIQTDFNRWRNYELEWKLQKEDIGYFIKGNCPINGFNCTVPEELW